jgi:CHAT domain-containing protein
MNHPFCIDWHGGPSAQLEIFSGPAAQYQLKYTPAFRSTIRPPVTELNLGEDDLQPINADLDRAAQVRQGSARHGASGAVPAPSAELEDSLRLAAQQLFAILPTFVQDDLNEPGLSLEIGVDERILQYPWELLHDGADYLCLKHNLGRFVNSERVVIPRFKDPWSKSLEPMRLLIISVPHPVWANRNFDPLPEAEAETTAIVEAISRLRGVEVELLTHPNATANDVFKALKAKPFHIVHFNGHADLDPKKQNRLVLQDRGMSPSLITNYFGKRPPILCFINACETAAVQGWREQHDIYGIARTFLETDSYLLGTRWKLSDKVAATFAGTFYQALLVEQKPIGQAIVESRRAAKAAEPFDPGWASYIYYGDPRLWFRRRSANG